MKFDCEIVPFSISSLLILLLFLSLLEEAPHDARSGDHAHDDKLCQDDDGLPLHVDDASLELDTVL